MRLPKYLVESDPLLSNVTQVENTAIEITDTEWTVEELEQAERQVLISMVHSSNNVTIDINFCFFVVVRHLKAFDKVLICKVFYFLSV